MNDPINCQKCGLPEAIECTKEEKKLYLCSHCAEMSGYCAICGVFCGDEHSYSYIHPGFCDDCFENDFEFYSPDLDYL